MPRRLCWRKLDGTRIAGFDRGLLHDDSDALTVLSVGELSGICVDALRERGVEVSWGQRVVSVGGTGEGDESAWVETESGQRFEAEFVVGCDGGNSAVRRLVLGREGFEGFTWGEQIVATNVSLFPSSRLQRHDTDAGEKRADDTTRRTTTSPNSAGKRPTSSSTTTTGTWQHRSAPPACGASPTANYRA